MTASTESHRGKIADLLVPSMRKTSFFLWFIWFATAFCYYGMVLLVTELFTEERYSTSQRT